MEALSGAASGIAVVSLAIQLLQSVRTMKTFIRDIEGVSKELEHLADLLDRLGALLDDVRNTMERQRRSKNKTFRHHR
jgi:heme exporter protein D